MMRGTYQALFDIEERERKKDRLLAEEKEAPREDLLARIAELEEQVTEVVEVLEAHKRSLQERHCYGSPRVAHELAGVEFALEALQDPKFRKQRLQKEQS